MRTSNFTEASSTEAHSCSWLVSSSFCCC